MYKPSLKRTTLTKDTQPTINNTFITNLYRYQPSSKIANSYVMIPSKILQTPQNKNKDKCHLFAPLLIKSHKYPKGVSQQLKTEASLDSGRGVGGYREINWLFQGKKLTLWITDKDNEIVIYMDEDISAVAMGELKAQYLPSKIKNRYIFAIGSGDTVSLYSLNNFTLKTYQTGIKYKIRHSLLVQSIKFVEENKILVGTNTGMVELIEFGQRESVKRLQMPYYRYIVPVTSLETTIKIQQLIYSQSKIYALMTEINPKSWVRSLWQGLFSQASVPYTSARYIQVFQVGATIVKKQKIFESELSQKIKSYIPVWKTTICIKSIYIDRQSSKDQELGIVTECGCFLTLRTTNYSLSREPLFAVNINQLEQCRFLTQKKFEPVSFTTQQTKNYRKIVSSLGYQNLTLLDDSLLWMGEERIDGVLSSQIIGEIYEKREYQISSILDKNRQWGLFDFKNYYTVKQLPIRQFIATIFYIKNNLTNEYLGLHYTEEKFNAFLEKYIKLFSPEIFLKYLIEIIVSQERFLTINPYLIELIEGELKDEKAKDFKDWKHELTPSVKTQQIFLNEHILNHIWSMILEMQYRELSNYPSKFVNLYQSNVFWLTMHQLYHNMVGPLYHMNPQDFRNNKAMIQDITQNIESVIAFFAKKEVYERCIRDSLISKPQKKDTLYSLDNTSSSFLGQQDLSWIPEAVKRSVAGRVINQNYQLLQGKIRLAFKATAILMKIYFNIQDYTFTKQGNDLKRHSKLEGTTFKEVLSSKQLQKYIKKQLLTKLDYKDLQELDKTLPCFNLQQDIRYLRCIKKVKLQKLPKDQLELQEIAEAITSDYFEDIDSIFEKRYDLKLKALWLYQLKLLQQKQGLVKSNTLQETNIINKTFFPEDQEEMLKHKRSHLDKELQLVLEEQKKCISTAIHAHTMAKTENVHSLATVLDQIIIHISDKSYLLLHTEQELRKASLIRQMSQLQRIKPRSMPGTVFSAQVKIKPQFLRRDLFPPPF